MCSAPFLLTYNASKPKGHKVQDGWAFSLLYVLLESLGLVNLAGF